MSDIGSAELLALLDAHELRPDVVASVSMERCRFRRIERPEEARSGGCSWLRSGRLLPIWQGTLLVVDRAFDTSQLLEKSEPWAVISVDDPRLAMLRILQHWFSALPADIRVERSARIHPSSVVGASDAGYVWTGDRYELFPHVGGVRIGARVEIDPLSVVSRAAIGDTIIGEGSKIGPQVTVGHGSHIGRNCVLVAQVCLAGSTVLGDGVVCWQRSTTASGVHVGAGSILAAGAVVLQDVPPGEVWAGVPARRIRGVVNGR